MWNINRLYKTFAAIGCFLVAGLAVTDIASARTYTENADFDEGILTGVEHETVYDQLQLSKVPTTLPFIWVPNEQQGTVSKVNTATGVELGRYRVAPSNIAPSPSRTTVDLNGNCWVGNRQAGTVVKMGLLEGGQCADRNANGVIDTSSDANNDGIISGGELKAWGQDECVLLEVVLIPGKMGAYVPGTYTSGYDTNGWSTSPRGLAIDSDNNLWAGTWTPPKFHHINGETGAIIKSVNLPAGSYGAVIDNNGILWSSALYSGYIMRLNTLASPPTVSTVSVGHTTYGIGLDYLGHLFVAGWDTQRFSRINVTTGIKDWTFYKSEAYQTRGVAVTADNNVWVVSSYYGKVYRYNSNGNLIATISGFSSPTGVSVNAAGKVWVTDLGSEYIHRVDPSTNKTDLSKRITGGGGHYTYSDMTGYVSRTVTTKTGAWTAIYDSGAADTEWGKLSWSSDEPSGTSITVRVSSSNDKVTWSAWETAVNGQLTSATPAGQYLKVEAGFKITQGEISPILYDITVDRRNQPPVAEAGPHQTVEMSSCQGASVTLDGSGSYDPDGDALTYTWTENGTIVANGVNPVLNLPYGSHTLTLTVDDGKGGTATDDVVIDVVDTTAPTLTVALNPRVLWPPNHKYTTIAPAVTAGDACAAALSVQLLSATSNEPDNGLGDGDTVNDIVINSDGTLSLRAERSGKGSGRVYTVTYQATDIAGNTTVSTATVSVPHNR